MCVKDFVSYETGEWKCFKLFLVFVKILCKLTLVVKKWIPQYGAAVVNLQAMKEETYMSIRQSLFA